MSTQESSSRLPADETLSPPRCSELRNDGQPCRAYATSTGKCAGHSKLGALADPQRSADKANETRRKNARKRAEAAETARMTAKQRIDLLAEKQAAKMEAAFQAAIRTGSLEDLRRAQASELLLSRVYGRPTERVETKADLPPVLAELERFTPEERRALLAGLASGKRLRVVEADEPETKAS